MNPSSYDLKSFYNSREGRVIRRVLQSRIAEIWSDTKDLRIMGCGYATPYLNAIAKDAERAFALMSAGQGAHQWPNASQPNASQSSAHNLVCLSEQSEIPIETNSVDRVLMVHDLEYCEFPETNLSEIWRVLKSNGRLMVVTPNRSGLWARADWSPFGHGRPYSATQLCNALRENLFVHESTHEALFMLPVRYNAALKTADILEKVGRSVFPLPAGVHIVEASKQLYARADKGHGAKLRVRGRGIFMPKPALNRFERK